MTFVILVATFKNQMLKREKKMKPRKNTHSHTHTQKHNRLRHNTQEKGERKRCRVSVFRFDSIRRLSSRALGIHRVPYDSLRKF